MTVKYLFIRTLIHSGSVVVPVDASMRVLTGSQLVASAFEQRSPFPWGNFSYDVIREWTEWLRNIAAQYRDIGVWEVHYVYTNYTKRVDNPTTIIPFCIQFELGNPHILIESAPINLEAYTIESKSVGTFVSLFKQSTSWEFNTAWYRKNCDAIIAVNVTTNADLFNVIVLLCNPTGKKRLRL